MTRSSFFHRISACLLFFLGVLLLNACADEERKLPPTSPAGEGFSSQVLVLCQGNQATRLPGGYTLIDTEHQTVHHDFPSMGNYSVTHRRRRSNTELRSTFLATAAI